VKNVVRCKLLYVELRSGIPAKVLHSKSPSTINGGNRGRTITFVPNFVDMNPLVENLKREGHSA
jgi:hypothetical protein